MYIPATSLDSSAMVEHMCTLALSKQLVTTYQQRVNHESVPFPLPPYSALPLTLSKSATFSDNCQPHVDNKSAFSVTPDQSLNRADPQQQLIDSGSWSGNVRGNSEPTSAPATHVATNGTASPYPSTTSPCQPLSPTSPTQPSQPPQQGQSAHPTGTGSTTRKGRRRVPCTCPNCVDDVNGISNQDRTVTQKQHICHYPGCGKVFIKQQTLLVHLRRHRGEKLYICNWSSCGKKFVTNSELKQHRLIHTGEKKYVCKECSKRFIRKDYLEKHTKTTHVKGSIVKRSLVQKIDSPGNSSSSSSSSSSLNQSFQQIAMTSS